MYVATLEAARRAGARWIVARAGARIRLDGMSVDVLHPRARVAPHEGANDYSAVLLIRFGTFRALLLGDAPAAAEEWLVARHGGGVRAQVLKVGHHGSATSSSEVLLRTVRPALAVITVGRRNRYGHPDAGVLERLTRNAVGVLRTDERGTIVVRADARGRFSAAGER
jgi:competence protein ComEC